jgi:hypothetical protein
MNRGGLPPPTIAPFEGGPPPSFHTQEPRLPSTRPGDTPARAAALPAEGAARGHVSAPVARDLGENPWAGCGPPLPAAPAPSAAPRVNGAAVLTRKPSAEGTKRRAGLFVPFTGDKTFVPEGGSGLVSPGSAWTDW